MGRWLWNRGRRSGAWDLRGMLERAFEDAADAILVLDGHGVVRLWNRGAAETFGYASREMVGKPYEVIMPPGSAFESALGKGARDFRTKRMRKDGSILEVSITRSPIRSSGEEQSGFIEILRDISDQRELERELIKTEKMAAVGKIASKVVHEIRNPLGSINLNCDILIDSLGAGNSPEEKEAREILQTIKRETRRLTQITEEYLQFSRMPQPTGRGSDLNAVMLELADFLRPELRRNGIRLVLNLDDRRPIVACDARLVRQIVLNLIRNAMDVVPAQSGQVMVVTLMVGDGGEISVDDNGPGIKPDVLPHIFEPFFTTKQDGTGLGLAVVAQIVEEHGGTLTCQSLPDKGTTFRIRLPGRAGDARRKASQ